MTQNADGPMRPCPTPTARSAYESESESICTAAGSMHDVKNLITTSWQTRRLCLMLRRIFKMGVPFGPTVLGYPPSDCSADFTTRTPIHPYNTSFSQILKICRRWHLRAKSLRRRHEFRSNFGIFLGLLPPRGATNPKIWAALETRDHPLAFYQKSSWSVQRFGRLPIRRNNNK